MQLNRSRRAGASEGQRLKTKYGIWSMGEGADDGRDLLMATISSSMERRLKSIAC